MSDRFGGLVAMLNDQFPSQLQDGIEMTEAGEWLVRVIVSMATLEPAARPSDAETERWIRTFVLPGFLADRSRSIRSLRASGG